MDRTLAASPPSNERRGAHAVGLAEWFSRRAGRQPERPALTCDGTSLSYGQLQIQIERMSSVLASGGVMAGARVGYIGLNDNLFVIALFAAARLGAILVPLNYRLSAAELAFIIGDAGVHTLFADDERLKVIDGVRSGLPCQRYIHWAEGAPGWESANDLLARATPDGRKAVPVAADDVALIMYTSGTTGNPKGAMLTHGSFWANNINEILVWDMVSTDVTLNFAPMFHVGGLLCSSMATLVAGGHLVLQRGFDAAAAMQAIQQYQVNVTFGVPAMLLFISQHPDFQTADLSCLRLVAVGGAPVPEPLLKLYAAKGIPVHQGYGMTEATCMVTFLSADRAVDKLGSCGKPPLLSEVCILDQDGGSITEPGLPGEICIRGANLMKGYWNQPEATDACFTRDGWFRTGDVGYLDDEGFLFICDRLKDMVISGGENIYPAEVESVLYEHSDIAEVAVIGAPDERWGERVVAVVALKPGKTLTLEELQAFAEKRLARYKLPRELRLVEALPRNPTGKVVKSRLRQAKAAS